MCMLKGNATRWCFENGTWQSKPDYSQCLDWPEMQSVKYVYFSLDHACSNFNSYYCLATLCVNVLLLFVIIIIIIIIIIIL